MFKKICFLVLIIMVTSMVFSACTPKATEAPAVEEAEEAEVVEAEEEVIVEEEDVMVEEEEEAVVEEEEEMAAEVPDVVVLTMTATPDHWMQDFSGTATAGYAQLNVFQGLVRYGKGMVVIPGLAESWELSEDQLTWTFHLFEGIKWHDGTPFTADDVKFTYEYGADPDYLGGTGPMSLALKGAQAKSDGEADEIEGLVVIDDLTIQMTTEAPNALFLETVAMKYIQPKHILEDVPVAELAESSQASIPIVTGPYMVTDIKADETITFTAFDDYFGENAKIKTYIWRILPELSVMRTELLAGNVDFNVFVAPEDFDELSGNTDLDTLQVPGVAMTLGEMNQTAEIPFFADKRVRQALAYAVDKEAMNIALNNGMGTVITTPIHPSLPEFNSDIEPYPYDPQMAMDLLEDVGWTDEDGDGVREAHGVEGIADGTPFAFELGGINIRRYFPQALIVQDYLKEIGIDCTAIEVEFNIFWSEYEVAGSPDWDIAGTGWFNLGFHSQTELEWNYGWFSTTGFVNEEVAAMIDSAPFIFDPAERNQLYWDIQEIIHEDSSVLFWTREDNLFAYKKGLVISDSINSLFDMYNSIPDWFWE
ncbi:MAG: ABC transporter substrate-binding protein [Anaerolineaceae bacterium]|nr:ABC transporter substrate-binding protein [Anaerolineaceae bacterium]